MENRLLSSTNLGKYEYGYEQAYRLAAEQLAKVDDIERQCRRSGARYIGSKKLVILEYLGQSYQITLPEIEISLPDGEAVVLKDKILLLHYLTQAKGTPLLNRVITYRELPEGISYFPTFAKRAIKPLVDHLGEEPQRVPDIARIFGGYPADYGDVAVTINAFSRVPITLVLWRGDEEFPPQGNILFDSTISDYLSTEDINVLCESIAWRLVKLLRAGGDNHSSGS